MIVSNCLEALYNGNIFYITIFYTESQSYILKCILATHLSKFVNDRVCDESVVPIN